MCALSGAFDSNSRALTKEIAYLSRSSLIIGGVVAVAVGTPIIVSWVKDDSKNNEDNKKGDKKKVNQKKIKDEKEYNEEEKKKVISRIHGKNIADGAIEEELNYKNENENNENGNGNETKSSEYKLNFNEDFGVWKREKHSLSDKRVDNLAGKGNKEAIFACMRGTMECYVCGNYSDFKYFNIDDSGNYSKILCIVPRNKLINGFNVQYCTFDGDYAFIYMSVNSLKVNGKKKEDQKVAELADDLNFEIEVDYPNNRVTVIEQSYKNIVI